MLRVFHPAACPIDAADDHLAVAIDDPRGCPETTAAVTANPIYCTRAAGHDGAHRAGITADAVGTLRPMTPDTLPVVAEWDDNRTTDGLL